MHQLVETTLHDCDAQQLSVHSQVRFVANNTVVGYSLIRCAGRKALAVLDTAQQQFPQVKEQYLDGDS